MTHAESIDLIDGFGRDFTPELKTPRVAMPFNGFSQADFAQAMIDDYRAAGIKPSRVWPQSFLHDDIRYWLKNEPRFGKQAVFLESVVDQPGGYDKAVANLDQERKDGVNVVAPPMWVLVTLDHGRIVPSTYARKAKRLGFDIITWTLERSGLLFTGGGYYYQSVAGAIDNDGDVYTMLDVLAQDVGIRGIFSDWPATVTYYANCKGL